MSERDIADDRPAARPEAGAQERRAQDADACKDGLAQLDGGEPRKDTEARLPAPASPRSQGDDGLGSNASTEKPASTSKPQKSEADRQEDANELSPRSGHRRASQVATSRLVGHHGLGNEKARGPTGGGHPQGRVSRSTSSNSGINGGLYETPQPRRTKNAFDSRASRNGPPSPLLVQTPSSASMQSPGLDLKYISSGGGHPLLPTGLLMGSPYTPGSPSTFASPFHSFATFSGAQSPGIGILPYPAGASSLGSPHVALHPALVSPAAGVSFGGHRQPSFSAGQSRLVSGRAKQSSQLKGHQGSLSERGSSTSESADLLRSLSRSRATNDVSSSSSGKIANLVYGRMRTDLNLVTESQEPNMNLPSRTVYLGNMPANMNWEEVFNVVRFGPIESAKYLPEKSCVFISFINSFTALAFYQDATSRKFTIQGNDIKIGWGRSIPVPHAIQKAINVHNATRNVYIGSLSEDFTVEKIQSIMSPFGTVEKVNIVRDKRIAFVHFTCISMAMKAVEAFQADPEWADRRVSYGRDRCVRQDKQQPFGNKSNGASGYGYFDSNGNSRGAMSPTSSAQRFHYQNAHERDFQMVQHAQQLADGGSQMNMLARLSQMYQNMYPSQQFYDAFGREAVESSPSFDNRTIYLGSVHQDTTIEEICNVVRGGILQHIRYLTDRHIAFITFIYPGDALNFYQMASVQGVMIHNRRLKVGWGKKSGPLPASLQTAVANGATRNIYVGNIGEDVTEDWLRDVFSQFGEIELINTLREKSCAFVNFTNISSAIKALEGARQLEECASFKINYGKDRCGNPPRIPMSTGHGAAQSTLQNNKDSAAGSPQPNGSFYAMAMNPGEYPHGVPMNQFMEIPHIMPSLVDPTTSLPIMNPQAMGIGAVPTPYVDFSRYIMQNPATDMRHAIPTGGPYVPYFGPATGLSEQYRMSPNYEGHEGRYEPEVNEDCSSSPEQGGLYGLAIEK